MFGEIDYGNLPTWLEAVGTLLAFWFAALTYRRSYNEKLREQAGQVHVIMDYARVADPDRARVTATVMNESRAPIYDVWLKAVSEVVAEDELTRLIEHYEYIPAGARRAIQASVLLKKASY